LAWYRSNKRDLPWRKTRDPYRILVSEIMLQQTQVATVIPYYLRFVRTFPNVASLAGAPVQSVLKQWEGLGYYARARNLQRAAQFILQRWKGRVPRTIDGLNSLPGIGRYTAGAVGSIAFNLKVPVLDGNVRRVLCRLLAVRQDPRRSTVQERLWQIAEELLPARASGTFNQALMELGATVCSPKSPSCDSCPVRSVCMAFHSGMQDRLPVRNHRRPVPHTSVTVALILSDRGVLIGPRPDQGLLAGLWDFPELDGRRTGRPQGIEWEIDNRFGLKAKLIRMLDPVAHAFSHKHLTYNPCLLRSAPTRHRLPDPWRWVPVGRIGEYPLPTATRKIVAQLSATMRPTPAEPGTLALALAAERSAAYRRIRK